METVDFTKEFKELYSATRKIQEVTAERGLFLTVDGRSAPGSEEFQHAISQLYSVAYTLKYSLKAAGVVDFKVPRLECLWLVEDPRNTPVSEWEWRVQLRVPPEVTRTHLKETVRTIREKKDLDASAVKLTSWREGRALQMMHVGPYDQVEKSYTQLGTRAEELGYRIKGPGHEIYVNDPNRVAPEKLKTIVRLPIAHPRPDYARG